LIIYIHTNPIKHGFTNNCIDYPWSSYHSIINNKPTNINRKQVLDWFENSTNFVKIHENKTEALLDEKFNLE
jgi:hypothetical protein